MRFGFLNNFAAQIAEPLNATVTSVALSEGADLITAALENSDAVALTLFATDSEGSETKREVVYATGVAAGLVTIERGQEGTEAQPFDPEDGAEARLTAGMLQQIVENGQLESTDYANTLVLMPSFGGLGGGSHSNIVCIGGGVYNDASDVVVLGWEAYVESDKAVALGAGVYAGGEGSICIGHLSQSYSYDSPSIVIGVDSYTDGSDSILLGSGLFNSLSGVFLTNTVSCLPENPESPQKAFQVVLATAALDITSGAATATIILPSGTILLPDAFDVVVVESSGAAGSPEIQIGHDSANPAEYLAATPITKTAVGGRETHTPLVTDGIPGLRVSVASTGTGTAYKIKVVVRGYVMEV